MSQLKQPVCCYFCGRAFKPGDQARWQADFGKGNCGDFLVCAECDGPDVVARWHRHYVDGKRRFWWMG